MEQTRYEILVRRDGENKYSAFCPELNILVKGTSHEGVEMEIRKRIKEIMQQRELSGNEVPKK
jgi:predicted RNase H-like HicB family nuclease